VTVFSRAETSFSSIPPVAIATHKNQQKNSAEDNKNFFLYDGFFYNTAQRYGSTQFVQCKVMDFVPVSSQTPFHLCGH
jgi:hypothetical protein